MRDEFDDEGFEDEAEETGWPSARPAARPAVENAARLLAPLAAAEDALSRLDAAAGAAPEAVREGLVARLSFAEAAGWLAAVSVTLHPRDLALRAERLTGSYSAAAFAGRLPHVLTETAQALHDLPEQFEDEPRVEQALTLARLLQRLATLRSTDPLDSPSALSRALRSLGDSAWPSAAHSPAAALPEFNRWRRDWLAAGREAAPLLAAAEGVAVWMREAGQGDSAVPQLGQGVFLAAVLLRRRGRLRHVPLVFWAGPRRLGPVLRGPLDDPAGWPLAFLGRVREAALRGLDELDRLNEVAQRAAVLAASGRKSSSLGRVVELALRRPVITAPLLAAKLALTHQGALLLLNRLVAEGVLREATGRKSFRAFVVAG
ncbi:helix-turn-helix domain-containing protein [Roseomonas elaeocarpi]|uniref:Helix-turn-helix domain-containing protein n=1 Tax=Roseomonas elaeocarpi TaxID=907779 RepID=A0ABV6JP31_9PROT